MRADIAPSVREWLQYNEFNHSINVACKTCGMDVSESPISHKTEHKLFLVISTYYHQNPKSVQYQSRQSAPPRSRTSRSLCNGESNDCCRENLHINFAEIGWSDWIIFPTDYNAYFCKGSCSSAAQITLDSRHYNSVIRVSILLKVTYFTKSL